MLERIFSGSAGDLSRWNPIGLIVMALGVALAALAGLAEQTPTLLTIYEGPKTMATSETARVSVNGYDLFVYDVMVNHENIWNANTQPTTTRMTYFDF